MNWIMRILRFWKTIQIVLIYVVGSVLVYFLFPREGKFRYEYSKNEPWMHETLVAPFDFPIYKPEQQVQRERDSLQRNTKLYFFHDSLIGKDMVNSFNSDYSNVISSMGIGSYVADAWTFTGHIVADLLKDIYDVGVIERTPVLEGKELESLTIMTVRNSLATEVRFSSLYTERTAYEHLIGEIERINPGSMTILNRMNLSEYIRANLLFDEQMTTMVQQEKMQEITLTQGMVQAGQLIISRGELISASEFCISVARSARRASSLCPRAITLSLAT